MTSSELLSRGMIDPGMFSVEPWAVTEPVLHLDLLGQTESIFALSNGHIGLRGNLDEGEPHAVPGTYLNGFFETLPLPYAEAGLRLSRRGPVADRRHQRQADPPAGRRRAVRRPLRQCSSATSAARPARRRAATRGGVDVAGGQAVRVRSTRLVSFVQRAVAAIRYEVESLDEPARIVVQSTLVANEPVGPRPGRRSPRRRGAARPARRRVPRDTTISKVALGHDTRVSGLRMAAAIDHVVDGPDGTPGRFGERAEDLARVTVSTELAPGQSLRVVKLLAYGWSAVRSMPALRDQVDAALAAAKRTGWDGLRREQRDVPRRRLGSRRHRGRRRRRAPAGGAVRLFQVVQAAARAEQRAIPAKGLTGRGYDGHTFWDMETYTLPVLTYTLPRAARDALRWRHTTLELARARAGLLRLEGAAFPWRTIRGEECSGYWPASTAAFHINADIADAVRRYIAATGDVEFERGPGLELLVETARLWRSLGHHDAEGRFRIDGVTGPDEYTALVDNNVFTNLMAARNFRAAADAVGRHPDRAVELRVEEPRSRRGERLRTRSSCRSTRARRDGAVRGVHALSTLGLCGDRYR